MNPTENANSLASLFMSLGGSIDLTGLESTDRALPGLSDFSNLLQDLTTDSSDQSLISQLSGNSGAIDGENLPLNLPLDLDFTMDSGLDKGVYDADIIMEQIEQPPQLSLNLMPVTSMEGTDTEPLTSIDSSRSDDMPQVLVGSDTASTINANAKVLADTSAVSVTTVASDTSMSQQRTLMREATKQQGSVVEQTENIDSEYNDNLSKDISSTFRPVTAVDETFKTTVSLEAPAGQHSSAPGNSSMSFVTSASSLTAGLTDSPEGEGQDASSSDEIMDDDFENKLQHQMRERLEFGRNQREWGTTLGTRVLTMVAEDVQQAKIQLDPPELGSLEIRLKITNDQANVQVQAQHQQVRDVLEANIHRLRDALNAQGIELAGFDVGTQSQQNQSGSDYGDSSGSDSDWIATEDATESSETKVVANSTALLDTFA